ncbi:MAG: peptidoglycan-binding protein [Deltaproteobacteria bacterium]|nr:peptidoglycan-binding protein [Deltaproteobacteria bacterium]
MSVNIFEPQIRRALAGLGTQHAQSTPASIHGRTTLGLGRSGSDVVDLQAALNRAGAQPPLLQDGVFGPLTEGALKRFQSCRGLPADGRLGLETRLALQNSRDTDAERRATGGSSTPARAPRFSEGRPAGTMRAGELARADDQRRTARSINPGARPVNSAATSGATPARTVTSVAPRQGDDVQLDVPWLSQFDAKNVPDAGNTACYRAVREMMSRTGVNIAPGTQDRIQVATSEDALGRVQTDPRALAEARRYIDRQLDAGRPVAVGVSHMKAGYNADGITDHFVAITGRGTDEQGRTYYTYHDPAVTNGEMGRNNRFYVDPRSGNLVHEGNLGTGLVRDRHTEMSMVVRSS